MRDYIQTDRGAELASASGLESLADRLVSREYEFPPIVAALSTDRLYSPRGISDEEILEAVTGVRSTLKTTEELAMFERGMATEPQTDTWRFIGNEEVDALFPIRAVVPFAKATEDDRLVLSGAAGLNLTIFRGQCQLLARSRYKEYGFRTFNEACAFAGAYVIGKLIHADVYGFKESAPSYSYTKDNTEHTVSVGGTIHGDFRIFEEQRVRSDVLSPISMTTEFGPHKAIGVAGYHSIESEIIASLIEAEYLRSGADAAQALVEEFVSELSEYVDESGRIPYRRGPFGDYGAGDNSMSLLTLRLLLTRPEYKASRRTRLLHSSTYLPQSSTLFEIVQTDEGVKFQNRDGSSDGEVEGINVAREQYVDLLTTMVGQTAGGLGRTSPSQIVQIVLGAKGMLEQYAGHETAGSESAK